MKARRRAAEFKAMEDRQRMIRDRSLKHYKAAKERDVAYLKRVDQIAREREDAAEKNGDLLWV
eukprot:1395542-Amorphochlora_amoeboformis.AAC.2